MPITLPPLTRRHWLKQSVAAGLAALAPRPAFSAETQESWVLFSDTHIAADPKLEARGISMADNLSRSINQVLALKQKPFGVLINGDCVYLNGLQEDYQTFVSLLTPLREASLPVHCTLGNHDDRKNFIGAMTSPEDVRPLEGRQVEVFSSAAVNWVLLDSLDQVNKTPGILGEAQLRWLDRTLRSLPDRPTFVMAHHNPNEPLPEGKKPHAMLDSDAMFAILGEHKKVRAFIYGHTHNWAHTLHAATGIHLINLPPVAYVFDQTRPNGWVLARVIEGAMEFELRSLNPNHDQHRQKITVPFTAA